MKKFWNGLTAEGQLLMLMLVLFGVVMGLLGWHIMKVERVGRALYHENLLLKESLHEATWPETEARTMSLLKVETRQQGHDDLKWFEREYRDAD